jgi:hypothetical protein
VKARAFITGLLIAAELKQEGLDFIDRSALQYRVPRHVATDTPASPSAEGLKKADTRGFDLLAGTLDDSREDVHAIFAGYKQSFV